MGNFGPFGPKLPRPSLGGGLPVGGIRVGNGIGYPDENGVIHSSASAALESNMASEKDMTRGGSGACTQDFRNMPDYKPPRS